VEQLLAVVAEGGALNRIPPTIQALLEARLDALPEAERDVLERAAVIGLEFEWTALAELDREQRRPGGVLLAALVRKELIRPHDAIEDTFQFRHALIRDAAYQSISKDLRADLHERFAGWLDGRGRPVGARGVVADATVSLTDLRFHRPAHTGVGREDVLRELEGATQVFEELGEKAGLGRALCFRGKVLFWGGDSAAAIEDLELAAGYARAAGDQAQVAESLRYVLVALCRGSTPVEEALERTAEIHSVAGSNRRLERSALAGRATLEAMLGRFDAAR